MKTFKASSLVPGLACIVLCSGTASVTAQDLTLSAHENHTVVGDEAYGKLEMFLGSTLTIPDGTSITMTERSFNDGGTIILDGGDYTISNRQDFGRSVGGTLLANSGTFSVLDTAVSQGWQMADNPPRNEEPSQIIIGDAEVYADPGIQMFVDRKGLITFTAGGSGFLDIAQENPVGNNDPNVWLALGMLPENEGFGLVAPGNETIQISVLANGHTRVTSVFVLRSSGKQFTWGELLADGSWGNAAGWKEDGAATTNIPTIDEEVTGDSDEVEILGGTLRVEGADRGAWSVDVRSSAAAIVSGGNTLRIAKNFSIDGGGQTEVSSGGILSIEQDLNVAAGGVLTIDDGTVAVARNAAVAGTVAFTGTGTSLSGGGDFDGNGLVLGKDLLVWQQGGSPTPFSTADLDGWQANYGSQGSPLSKLLVDTGSLAAVELNSSGVINTTPAVGAGEVTVGQLTLSASSLLVKQGVGALFLEQSGGANSLAPGARLSIEEGTLAAINDAANNALDNGTISLDGGDLVLASTGPNAAAFDVPLQINRDAAILAAQRGSGAVAGETVTLGGAHAITAAAGAIGTLQTADGYSINLAANVSGAGRLDFGDGAVVEVQADVTPAGVGYSGDISNVSESGSIAPTSSYFFNPTDAHPDMTIDFPIAGALEVVVGDLDRADGSVGFLAALTHTGPLRLQRGALRLGGADNGPAAAAIEFAAHDLDRAAVVESAESTYNPTIGNAAGNIHWTKAGGFASRQGGAGTTVTVNGGAALDWDSSTNGFNGQALQLGSNTANAPVILTNDLNLGSAAERVIQVANNPNATADVARITGVIASSGTAGDVLRINKQSANGFRDGLLELLGNNTFANTLRLESGTVYAVQGTGLPTDANLQFSGNEKGVETVFATQGSFTRAIGTGAGQVSWRADDIGVDPAKGGGFAARGGPLNVTLAGGTVLGQDPSGLNGQDLHLGSQYADDVVTFNNNLDAQNAFHQIFIFDNPDSDDDRVVINGDVSNPNGLTFSGNGRVEFHGNVVGNTGAFRAGPGNAVVVFNGDHLGSVTDDAKFEVLGDSMLFLNGTVDVGEDVQFAGGNNSPSIGGSGRVNMFGGSETEFKVGPNGHLRPGPDVNAVGTLTVNLLADSQGFSSSFFQMQSTSTYHLQFAEEGGAVVHDSVEVINELGASFISGYLALEKEGDATWNVELAALEDLGSLISPADEFALIDIGEFVRVLDFDTQNFTILNAPILSGTGELTSATILPSPDFDVSAAKVMYEIGSSGGRIYVTGLTYTGAGISAIPEPTAVLLSLLGAVGLTFTRTRKRASAAMPRWGTRPTSQKGQLSQISIEIFSS